ncbi:MAG: protein kinase domain-containing protein [Jatrophihabitantaceae bacterium]
MEDNEQDAARIAGGATTDTPDRDPVGHGSGSGVGWVLAERYRVIDRIGSGGTAEVFRAHDELLDRDVAVKVFRTMADDLSKVPGGAERQAAELAALAQLNHPNLITLFDGSARDGGGSTFLVMELVEGACLAERLADGPLPEWQVGAVGAQLAAALAYVHSRGMVHRDIKPANILLGSDEAGGLRARLSDFGIVRILADDRITSANLTVGTAHYLAPEQALGAEVGPEADVYSLGLVLLEMLTGVRSYGGTPAEATAARLLRSPTVPSRLPEPWPAVLRAMTASDPRARPPAAAVAQALQGGPGAADLLSYGSADAEAMATAVIPRGLAGAPARGSSQIDDPAAAAVPATWADEPQDRRRRGAVVLGALAVILALALGSAGYLATRPSHTRTGPPGTSATTGAAKRPGTTKSVVRHGVTYTDQTAHSPRRTASTKGAVTRSSVLRKSPHPTASSTSPRTTAPPSSPTPAGSSGPSGSTTASTAGPSPTPTTSPGSTSPGGSG